MNQHFKHGLVVVMLTLASVASQLVPHMMGISTIGAVGMVAAAYLPRRYALIPVILTVFIGNLVTGFYGLVGMGIVYSAHAAATLSVRFLSGNIAVLTVGMAAVINAFVFYLVSNLSPIAMGFYPNTVDGWVLCYAMGVPFLIKGILSNLAFGGLAFGLIALIGASDAHRIFASKRD